MSSSSKPNSNLQNSNTQAGQDIQTLEDRIYQWLDDVVIGLNLCPFAKKPRSQQQIKLTVCDTSDSQQQLEEFITEMDWLANTPAEQTDTTWFAIANGLEGFESYLSFLDICQMALENFGYEGKFQLASFHPDYQFEGTELNDRENFTNRAPVPIIHLIREDSMTRVLKQYPNPEAIPERNIETVESLSSQQIAELFSPASK